MEKDKQEIILETLIHRRKVTEELIEMLKKTNESISELKEINVGPEMKFPLIEKIIQTLNHIEDKMNSIEQEIPLEYEGVRVKSSLYLESNDCSNCDDLTAFCKYLFEKAVRIIDSNLNIYRAYFEKSEN